MASLSAMSTCTQGCVTTAGKKIGCKGLDEKCFCSQYETTAGDASFAMCMIGCSFDDLFALSSICADYMSDGSGSSGTGNSGPGLDGLFPTSTGSSQGSKPTASASSGSPKSSGTSAPKPSSSEKGSEKSGGGLSTAAIAGIGAGAGVVVILIVVGIILCVCLKKRKRKRLAAATTNVEGAAPNMPNMPLLGDQRVASPGMPVQMHNEMAQVKSENPVAAAATIPELHTPAPEHNSPSPGTTVISPFTSPSPVSNTELCSVPPTAHSEQAQMIFELPATTKAEVHELG